MGYLRFRQVICFYAGQSFIRQRKRITGKTTGPEQLSYNQFLVWRGGKVKNFELRVKIKQSGNNTGIQYRSAELPEVGKWSIGGYQCDVHPTPANNAMVYDERGRGIITERGKKIVIDEQGQWKAVGTTADNDGIKWNGGEKFYNYT